MTNDELINDQFPEDHNRWTPAGNVPDSRFSTALSGAFETGQRSTRSWCPVFSRGQGEREFAVPIPRLTPVGAPECHD
jgi:hypothetical protein